MWSVYTGAGEHWDHFALAQMRSQKQLEQHSVLGNPNFLNPSQQNFHLKSVSPAIDQGTNVIVFTDIEGNTRPQGEAYDIGAFEFIHQPP